MQPLSDCSKQAEFVASISSSKAIESFKSHVLYRAFLKDPDDDTEVSRGL
jgi:hypothetical protein